MKRNINCQNCSRFSHCNNNNLFCIKFVDEQFIQLKEENEKLKEDNNTLEKLLKTQENIYNAACDKTREYYIKYQNLRTLSEKKEV